MEPVLLVRNDELETFGIAKNALAAAGVPTIVVDAIARAPVPGILDGVAGVVMFGGSMNADETDAYPFLLKVRALAREAVERGVPYLGICLGAQILARALDRPVFPAPVRELGFEAVRPTPAGAEDPLLSVYSDGDMVFHWHEDTLDPPEDAELLLTGDRVRVQAFRVGDRSWGVQFHFEIDRPEIELWLDDAGEIEQRWGKSAKQVLDEADEFLAEHEAIGGQMFGRFAEVVRGTA